MNRDEKLMNQYEILQTRVNLHGTRMWQLPFTYLGLIGVILSFTFGEEKTDRMAWIFIGLFVVGFVLIWALYGAYEGYRRTVNAMNEVEGELELEKYTKCYKSHYIPYFVLLITGILSSLLTFVILKTSYNNVI